MMMDPTQLSSGSSDKIATQETNTSSTIQIPNEFICPLTLDIMVDPLVSKFGQSYERMAIIEWITLHGNTTCPMTRRSLHLKDLITNHALAKRITQWKLDNQYETTASANTTISGRKLKKIKKRSSNSTQEDNDTDSDNDDDNNSQHTERILGMYYCTFVEETTDRSNDDPNIILEWRGDNNNNDDGTTVRPGRNNNRRIVSSSNTNTTATNQRRRQTTRNSGTSTNIQQQQELANNNNITTTTSSSKKFGSFLSRFRSSASTTTTATTSTMATPATSTELTA